MVLNGVDEREKEKGTDRVKAYISSSEFPPTEICLLPSPRFFVNTSVATIYITAILMSIPSLWPFLFLSFFFQTCPLFYCPQWCVTSPGGRVHFLSSFLPIFINPQLITPPAYKKCFFLFQLWSFFPSLHWAVFFLTFPLLPPFRIEAWLINLYMQARLEPFPAGGGGRKNKNKKREKR